MPSNAGAASTRDRPSLLSPIGYQSGDCGYCKNSESSASYYVRTQSLQPKHYQEMMDRGWRRSGSLLYLPDPSRSCCPHYTIRLPVAEYKPTRDQRQTVNRWNRHVLGEEYIKQAALKYPKSKAEKRRQEATFDLQHAVHEAEKANLKPDIPPAHTFEVTLEPDDFSPEKFALFKDYQQHVHREPDAHVTRDGFTRFLCASPIHRVRDPADGKPLGSYHQCYRLDGRLVAMAVLDLLPHAVSGVYFMYHRDVAAWSFGKLSAVREAALAAAGGYGFYYMGYYIHSCAKMRYKGDYRPQYVLDLRTFGWDPLDEAMRALMERRKFVCMSRERARQTRDTDAEDEPVLFPRPYDAMEAVGETHSLLDLDVPGVLSAAELRAQVDLDRMRIYLGEGMPTFEAQDMQGWEREGGLRRVIADFAAATGPTLARETYLHFGRA